MLSFCIFASIRVTRTSKAMQTTTIGTVANSLPQNEAILLTLLISDRFILFAELENKSVESKNRMIKFTSST